jgi:hypothetical protein
MGIWILAGWALVQAVPALLVAMESRGYTSAAGWMLCAALGFMTLGLIARIRGAWLVTLAYLAANLFVFALTVWLFVLVAAFLSLRSTDAPPAVAVVTYYLFLCWGFLYLFHPDVRAYCRGVVTVPSD